MTNMRARRAVLTTILVTVLLLAGQSLPAQARVLRSGTILSGVLTTAPAFGCGLQPECLPWLVSGCSPALAGRDPAWMSSIVDVADLADGSTPRTIQIRRGSPGGWILGGAYVQFWTRDCTEVEWTSWHSFWDCSSSPGPYGRPGPRPPCHRERSPAFGIPWLADVWTTFPIPRGVAWMTVSANDNVNIVWSVS